ncbi:HEPN domain-containing protein [Micromonospora sp. MS34]|uniref:ApeA N-terminal domain 1-containing protein n=1 Tax=Micromonospora sp. MS34 TaxID=3385971 RepID=UPI0039A2D652
MQPLDVTGSFWLPGPGQVKRHGRLVFDPKDGATLFLSDALAEKRADGVMVEKGGGNPNRILGLIEEPNHRQPVTLIDCGWLNRTKYYANAILIGGHFEDDDQTAFESVIVRLRDAAPWVGKNAISVEVDSALEGVDRREVVCRLDRPAASEGRFTRGKVALDFRWSREDVELESVKVNQWPEFVIEYDELTPLTRIYGDAGHLYNLSSLCTDRKDSFDSIYVYRSDHPEMLLSRKPIPGTRRSIELKARLGDPTQRKEVKPLSAHDVLVPLDDLGGIQAVAAWLDKAAALTPIVGSLLTMRSEGIYSENRFLNISSAAEGLHRATVGGSYLPPSEFRRLRRQIREKGVPAEHHAWFADVMAHANDPSLDRRLRDLARELPEVIHALVGDDVDAWIRAVKKVRNNLTHLDEGREAFDGADLHWLAESLFHVTRLCLLRRIGLVDDHLHKIAKSVRMQGTLHYVQEAVERVAGSRPAPFVEEAE